VPPDRPTLTSSRPLRAALLVIAASWGAVAFAAGPPYEGKAVDEVLRELGTLGLQLIYSSETVPGSLRVRHEPSGTTPAEILAQVLAEHGLRANRVGTDSYAIVRSTDATRAPGPAVRAAAPLEEIVIAASRYSLSADVPNVHTLLTQEEIEGLPRLADDSLKAVHRLPGAASNGLSGLANMRGGEDNETLVVFDGLPLYEPFHLRLLLSPASVLDPRVLSGLDVHAGGFTAEYGDRMSAIIEAQSLRPAAEAYYELGLSLFHTNALAAQRFAAGQGQWLAAIRRSNLDEVADLVDSEIGEPSYSDAFARLDYAFTDQTRGSVHVLLGRDRAEMQNDAETEFADATYRNSYAWATLEHEFSPAAGATAILSYTDVATERTGEVIEPGLRTGTVSDERKYHVFGLKLDGRFLAERWLHRAGLELRSLSADYAYASAVRFEPGYPGPDSPGSETVRASAPRPSGEHVAAYFTSRILVTDQLAAEFGLRWDEQTYGVDSDDQWGPRINLAYEFDASTRLRASWGRYQQFQGINELQVEDGVDEFLPAQQADHVILSLERDLPADLALRVEAYRKDYRDLKPRYESLFDPLSLVPELRWDRVRIAPDSARAEGVELLLTRRSEEPWNGWLSYAWSRALDDDDGTETRRSWDQTHAVGGGVTWSSGPWQATFAAAYHTGWPTTPVSVVDADTPDASLALGARNALRYDDYASVDVRVSRDFQLSRGELTAFAEITNALNRRNPCCTDYAYDDVDDRLVLERDYRHWLPLVPSLGVLWKF
jgi:outer membrane receptor protein involved in Fe transport